MQRTSEPNNIEGEEKIRHRMTILLLAAERTTDQVLDKGRRYWVEERKEEHKKKLVVTANNLAGIQSVTYDVALSRWETLDYDELRLSFTEKKWNQ